MSDLEIYSRLCKHLGVTRDESLRDAAKRRPPGDPVARAIRNAKGTGEQQWIALRAAHKLLLN